MLLKSSDFIINDLCEAYSECEEEKERESKPKNFYLSLKKWYKMYPAQEFRCFIKNKQLVAISQRNADIYFSFLKEMEQKIKKKIIQFFENKIKNSFEDDNYVMDVYLHLGEQKDRVVLIDFNPWCLKTDPLLFSWSELVGLDCSEIDGIPLLRTVQSNLTVVPISMQFGLPIDVYDPSRMNEMMDKVKQITKEQKKEKK